MIEELKPPRIDGDELIIETQSRTEVYDSKYLLAALLVYVAKGDRTISIDETERMLELIQQHFKMPTAESMELLRRVIDDIADNPDMNSLLRDLSKLLSEDEKEDIAVMLLKVAAVDGRQDAEAMDELKLATDLISIQPDIMHAAYDRYFEETGLNK